MARPEERTPLFQALTEHFSSKNSIARHQRLEVLLGILGFFCIAAFVTTIVAEFQGKPAVYEALILAFFLTITFFVYGRWKKGPRDNK